MLTDDEKQIIETALRDGGKFVNGRVTPELRPVIKGLIENGYLVPGWLGFDATDKARAVFQETAMFHGEWVRRDIRTILMQEGMNITLPAGAWHIKIGDNLKAHITIATNADDTAAPRAE